MALSSLVKLGYAKETTWGTAVPATKLLPVTRVTPSPNIEQILDDAKRGAVAKVYAAYQGAGHGELEIEGNFYPEELGMFLLAIFGADAVTGASAPYSHAFTPAASTVPSLTFEDQDPVQAWAYAGSTCEKLTLKFNTATGLITYTASFKCKLPTSITAASVTDATLAPFRGWQCTLTLAGSGMTRVISGEFTIARTLEILFTGNNTQSPNRIDASEFDFTAKYTVDASANDLTKYTNKTQESHLWVFTYGTGAGLKELDIQATTVDYGQAPMARDMGGVTLKRSWDMIGVANSTDGTAANPSPCKLTLKNSTASY